MTRAAASKSKTGDSNVEIFVGRKKCCQESKPFQLCPLGLQFYSPKRIEDLTLMEFHLALPREGAKRKPEQITCTGAVVRCQREKSDDRNYRVWIKFLDLPDHARERIRCVSRNGKHLCCFCENF